MAQIFDDRISQSVQVAARTKQSDNELKGISARKFEWLALGFVVLFALVIRVYSLGSFPDTVLADEADNVQDSVRILYGQHPANGFFGLDWTSQPALSAYKEAAFIAIFGFNIMAMRLSSALISTLALIPFYLLLRRQLSMAASLLATILLATNVWYLNFSRSGWNCIDICFYMLMAMLFLMWGVDAISLENGSRLSKWVHFAAAGFFCALGLYGYPAGRAITLAVIVFIPIALLFYRQYYKTVLLGFGLLFVVEALVFSPQGIYIAQNWEHFNGRSKVVAIFNNPDYKADPAGMMLRQLERNIRGPWDGSVNNTAQYFPVGEPQLDKLSGILILMGMLLSLTLARLRERPETWLWWLMLLAGWFSTQILTINTPNGARGIGYMPTLFYFAGAGLDGIFQLIQYDFAKTASPPAWARTARKFTAALLTGIILLAGYSNISHYIDWQNKPQTRKERYLYVTAREFPDWSAAITDRAKNQAGSMNVGQWRDAHPIEDWANPYNDSQ